MSFVLITFTVLCALFGVGFFINWIVALVPDPLTKWIVMNRRTLGEIKSNSGPWHLSRENEVVISYRSPIYHCTHAHHYRNPGNVGQLSLIHSFIHSLTQSFNFSVSQPANHSYAHSSFGLGRPHHHGNSHPKQLSMLPDSSPCDIVVHMRIVMEPLSWCNPNLCPAHF